MQNQSNDEDAIKSFMDALTASDKQHRRAMRGITPEIATELLKRCYALTDEQATEAQRLRDVVGMSEDDVIKIILSK
jgi:S-adenosylmethionine/arginine decarboxylase-like enzyme